MTKNLVKSSGIAILMWLGAASFYGYQYILRVAPGIMVEDLMAEFAIHATVIGVLSSCYMYPYSLLQIPVGIGVDRWGPRKMIGLSLLLCIIGAVLFACSHNIFTAYLSRILTGAGSAVGFIGASTVARRWFPERYLGLILSLTMWMATLGAMGGGVPFSWLMEQYGWRHGLMVLAGGGGILWLVLWNCLRDYPADYVPAQDEGGGGGYGAGLILAVKTPVVWLAGLCAFGLFLPLSIFGDVWGVTYFMRKYEISRTVASFCTMNIFVGMCLGSVFFSFFGRTVLNMSKVILLGSVLTVVFLLMFLYFPHENYIIGAVLVFMIGFAVGSELLCFAVGCSFLPVWATGVTVGVINTIMMVANAGMQLVTSGLVDYFWDGNVSNGMRCYSPDCLRLALSSLIGAAILSVGCSIVLYLWLRRRRSL